MLLLKYMWDMDTSNPDMFNMDTSNPSGMNEVFPNFKAKWQMTIR